MEPDQEEDKGSNIESIMLIDRTYVDKDGEIQVEGHMADVQFVDKDKSPEPDPDPAPERDPDLEGLIDDLDRDHDRDRDV